MGAYDYTTKRWLWSSPVGVPLVGGAIDRVHDRLFVWRADDTSALIDQHTGQATVLTPPPGPIWDADFSSNGQHLAVQATGGARVYDAMTGIALAGPRNLGALEGVAASDELLIGEGRGGDVSFFDLLTLEPIGPPLPISAGRVYEVDFDDDGSLMMTRGSDRTVRLIDVASRTQIGEAIRIPLTEFGVSLRPDGRELAVHSPFGVALWDLDPTAWEDAACRVAGRNPTREEWERYVGELAPYRATCPVSS
jgi:WD40 repeat protein